MKHFHHFKSDISDIKIPEKFTYPFYYDPHSLSKIAVKELQSYLEFQKDFSHNFGIDDNKNDLSIGKMFGVLVVKNKDQKIGYLCAFSGKLADESLPAFFVPPIFNMRTEGSFFKIGESKINELNLKISNLENNIHFLKLQKLILVKKSKHEIELSFVKKKLKKQKKDRKNRLKKAICSLKPDNLLTFKDKIKQESFNDQFFIKELTEYREFQVSGILKELEVFNLKIKQLKSERKKVSNTLQEQLFHQYQFLNQKKENKGIADIFLDYKTQKPPAGTGDCAAPKLLQYAFLNDLKPISLAEFWWGKSPNKGIRKHKNFYPACQGRCKPILNHMLKGISIDENPLIVNTLKSKKIEIIFEDDSLAIINKPEEFLTVPGKEISDSVFTRVKAIYPNASGPLIVHRLDMSTSGILIIAKTKDAHKKLQIQFIKRTIKKRYVAVLDGKILKNKGEINLPLRLDLVDRPRQLVCFKHGKKAKTVWEIVNFSDNKTRVNFYPITGRTHQLRVHAAHSLGLNVPILGDDLYGKKSKRLYLHAEFIEFKHPITKETINFTVPPNF